MLAACDCLIFLIILAVPTSSWYCLLTNFWTDLLTLRRAFMADGYAEQLTLHAMQHIVERHGSAAGVQACPGNFHIACVQPYIDLTLQHMPQHSYLSARCTQSELTGLSDSPSW